MLTRIRPVRFHRPTSTGRTKASFITCERSNGTDVEVVAKFSAGCDQGVTALGIELIAGCLAGDLGLPIPVPYLIEVDADWASGVPDDTQRALIADSSPIAFGSSLVTGGFVIWSRGSRISGGMISTALAVFAFDGAINNPDRRDENPNCLVKGDEIRIIDHELAFKTRGIVGWREPWKMGGLRVFETPGRHIFRAGLRGTEHDYAPIREAWSGLSDARLREYEQSVPAEWEDAKAAVDDALELVRGVRDNICGYMSEVERVLK